jgi:uncharacterized ubiquitin-like protein YukD
MMILWKYVRVFGISTQWSDLQYYNKSIRDISKSMLLPIRKVLNIYTHTQKINFIRISMNYLIMIHM